MKQFILNFLCAILAVSSTTIFKIVVSDRLIWKKNFLTFAQDLSIIAKIPGTWIASILFILSQILWLYILATQKLSIAYPLQLALTISLFTIVSFYFFKETIQLKQIIGLGLIFLGIALLKI